MGHKGRAGAVELRGSGDVEGRGAARRSTASSRTVSAEGYSGQAFSVYFPHTVAGDGD